MRCGTSGAQHGVHCTSFVAVPDKDWIYGLWQWLEGAHFTVSLSKRRAGLPQDFGGDGSVKCGEGGFYAREIGWARADL